MSTLLPILNPEAIVNPEAIAEGPSLTPEAQRAEEEKNKMRRYFEKPDEQLSPTVAHEPVCLYLETTNRCNLLCTTCPRTYEQLEPEADMPWSLFTQIIDQYPNIARVVLHGVGEPMLVKDLAERVAYLKARNIYVLFNTNGTVLNETNGRALIEAGLDELRVSLDAADPAVYQMVRGKDFFSKIVENVRNFTRLQRELDAPRPVVSLWLTGLRETVDQLPNFVRLAHSVDVREVYLQRLVFFDSPQSEHSLARAESALFEHTTAREEALIREAESIAAQLGIVFSASGAVDPGESIHRKQTENPWSLCRRPWSLMYITANGRVLPCCIAPFSMKGYGAFTLGDATQSSLREIWNGPEYQRFRAGLLTSAPPPSCTNCGLRWSL
jgi:MoaA/NifB/PqqE/SkfB family radical SAM enzyme